MSTIKVDTYLTRGGASEIAIDKLKGASSAGSMTVVGEGGSTTTNLQQGLAKYFSRINLTAQTETKGFNSSSINDFGTGAFDLSFTNNFADANYSLAGNHNGVNGNTASTVFGHDNSGLMSTSQVNVVCFNVTDGRKDATECSTQIWGDLA
jgi:hypothetical protein